jgi:hypothetical protein
LDRNRLSSARQIEVFLAERIVRNDALSQPATGELSGIRGNTDKLRQREPVPWMRAVAFANPTRVPAGNTNL